MLCYYKWCSALIILLLHLLLAVADGNRADDLVGIINQNRTSHKLSQLNNNPGLGCMALQYVEQCKANCSKTENKIVNCKPPEDDFTEVFAPNCGVELPTISTITGLIVGCNSKYVLPSLAFSNILVKDNKTLSVLRNKSHSEVGVGIVGARKKKGPYFWCVLFGNGANSSSFVLEDHGIGIKQKTGCFSGSTFRCSGGMKKVVNKVMISIGFLCINLLKFLL